METADRSLASIFSLMPNVGRTGCTKRTMKCVVGRAVQSSGIKWYPTDQKLQAAAAVS